MALKTDRGNKRNEKFSMSEEAGSADRSACRQSVSRAIEAALSKARMDAQAIENPLLAYFLDMAIAELKNGEGSGQQGSQQQQKAERMILVGA